MKTVRLFKFGRGYSGVEKKDTKLGESAIIMLNEYFSPITKGYTLI